MTDSAAPGAADAAARVATATTVIQALAEGDFAAAAARFAGPLRDQLPAEKLQALWRDLLTQAGDFQQVDRATPGQVLQYPAVTVVAAFARGHVAFACIFDDSGEVAGFQAHPDAALQARAPYEPPPYVTPDAFTETEVQVGTAPWALPGTLSLPNGPGPHPAVVLVHGSGAQDRNEALGPLQPFRDLAGGLAARGLAVLRYDKRTKVYGADFAAHPGAPTVWDETIDDAVAAVALLRTVPQIDPRRIFVLGHSLGGFLAPRIATADPDLAGLIIMAGLTRPFEDTIVAQMRYQFTHPGPMTPDKERQLAALEAQVANIKDPHLAPDTPQAGLLNVPASYWLDLRGYDPPAVAAGLSCPILILQAERDIQVTMEDFAAWQAALGGRPNVTLTSYPGLSHLFAPGEGTLEDYAHAAHVDPRVVGDIARWVEAQPPAA